MKNDLTAANECDKKLFSRTLNGSPAIHSEVLLQCSWIFQNCFDVTLLQDTFAF